MRKKIKLTTKGKKIPTKGYVVAAVINLFTSSSKITL